MVNSILSLIPVVLELIAGKDVQFYININSIFVEIGFLNIKTGQTLSVGTPVSRINEDTINESLNFTITRIDRITNRPQE